LDATLAINVFACADDASRSRKAFRRLIKILKDCTDDIDVMCALLTTCEARGTNFGRVCLSVCQTITFESLDVGSSYLHVQYIFRECGSGSYMKVIGSRSRSQDQKGRKSTFPQCKTSIVNNLGSIKHTAVRILRVAWRFGLWRIEWCDRHFIT